MKYTLTLLFALLLLGAKAQQPVKMPNADTGTGITTVEIVEKPTNIFKCVWPPSYPLVVSINRVEQEPDVPVDMKIRHYFATSFWD